MSKASRRHFLKNAVLTAGSIGATTGLAEAYNLERGCHFDQLIVTHYPVQNTNLPVGYSARLIFATDFHADSRGMPKEKLNDVVGQINSQNPDLVLLGGDFQNNTWGNRDWLKRETSVTEIAAAFSGLRASAGVIGVKGNHDEDKSGNDIVIAMDKVGIPVCENAIHAVTVKGVDINIACLPDFKTCWRKYEFGFEQNLFAQAADKPFIILSHDPITYKWAPPHPNALMQLSGHTHGGQVTIGGWAPYQPTPGTPAAWTYGKIEPVDDRPPLIVSSGIGTSRVPFRNTKKEIVVVTLQGPPAPATAPRLTA